ncbi:hypothetical protein BLX24_29140 [Arsenicibacter rosenii]|uniref:Uncharacterized protein n=1 Tax=Arsenicibacter rosenii TaxID=1750698 RepID=A0A1S2VCF3_9BACT|nr:hypothetical protein BLX24_29140 [Arsenicibacter rosenii]
MACLKRLRAVAPAVEREVVYAGYAFEESMVAQEFRAAARGDLNSQHTVQRELRERLQQRGRLFKNTAGFIVSNPLHSAISTLKRSLI